MTPSIYWYDYETTGTDPARDRAIQFAGIRTDLDLNVLEAPTNLLCFPGNDTLPVPEAIAVTGIHMSALATEGLRETEFIEHIHNAFSQPNTCVAGFNSLRFDDEFTRYTLYRNFLDPYAREWRRDNSRWDAIDLFRMAHALRPEGMNWPTTDDGVPTFRLEKLTEANGIGHENAHDAVADVQATIDLVRKQRQAQPKLYDYLFNLRRKQDVINQLYPLGKSPVIHVSSMYAAARNCIAVVLPLCSHPTNNNGVICYDLGEDPEELIQLGPEALHERIFTANADLEEGASRIHLKTIHVNRCPAVAPLATLRDDDAARLGIDIARCEENQKRLQRASGIVEKIQEAFGRSHFEPVDDPDLALYSGGFFSDNDRSRMLELRSLAPVELAKVSDAFDDERIPEMLFRYRARNFPETLDASELARWNAYRREKFRDGAALDETLQRIDELLAADATQDCLNDLANYVEALKGDFS